MLYGTSMKTKTIRVRTGAKAGVPPGPCGPLNHNKTIRVRSGAKAGLAPPCGPLNHNLSRR